MLFFSKWAELAIGLMLSTSLHAQNYPDFWHKYDGQIEDEEPIVSDEFSAPNFHYDKHTPDKLPLRSRHMNDRSPSFALGLGVNIPDILPFELIWLASPWMSLRTFIVPTLPFSIRVEYGRSVLATQNGLSIENPDLTVDFEGVYGPQLGSEVMVRPFRGNFYLAYGLSFRRLQLEGDLLSELILTSSAGSVETNSLISLKAKADASQFVQRVSIGWLWTFYANRCYVNFTLLGLTVPHRAQSDVRVEGKILNPNATVEVRNEIIEEAERRFAEDLSRQARDTIRPVEKLSLPIIGLSGGITF